MKLHIFSQSRLDGLLVLVSVVHLSVLLYAVLSAGSISLGASLLLGLMCVFLMCTNFQCVAHNFIHHPFFANPRWNAAFRVFNSLLLGGPQTLYRLHHLHHHKYNNDAPDAETGTTKDVTSTWRYGPRPDREEDFLSYALLGYFRTDFAMFLAQARKRRLLGRMVVETLAWLAMVVVLAVLNPLGVIAFYLPVWFLGNAGAQAQNYLEHHGAIPGNRKTDSVSSYGRLYNLIWFNNGYHQEHHYRPQVHWTKLPEITPLLPPETERHVVRGAHWFNFGRAREQQEQSEVVRNGSTQPAAD